MEEVRLPLRKPKWEMQKYHAGAPFLGPLLKTVRGNEYLSVSLVGSYNFLQTEVAILNEKVLQLSVNFFKYTGHVPRLFDPLRMDK